MEEGRVGGREQRKVRERVGGEERRKGESS